MKLLAGDWEDGTPVARVGKVIRFQPRAFTFEKFQMSDVVEFDVLTQENRASMMGKLGWGAAGAVLLGPLGLLAGVLAGGNKKDRVMSVTFSDGRKALIKGNASDVEAITAARFRTGLKATASAQLNPRRRRGTPISLVILAALLVGGGWFAYYVASHQRSTASIAATSSTKPLKNTQ